MLKELLKKKKVTQKELAAYLGVHQTLISLWTRGKCRPQIEMLTKLANFFDVPIEDIVKCFSKN